jgi:hypothetical protein
LTKNKETALKNIEELRDYVKGYFHISWDMDLQRLKQLIETYPEPNKKDAGVIPA